MTVKRSRRRGRPVDEVYEITGLEAADVRALAQ
jgi:hypothetical protein